MFCKLLFSRPAAGFTQRSALGPAHGLALAAAVALAPGARAQATAGGAVQAATDAFGTTIGRDSLGLYTSSSARGFSPTRAGNVRIDGLYIDPVATLTPALRESTRLRVGLSAQGFVFPAPTGVVDHSLRRPRAAPQAVAELGLDQFGSRYLDWSGASGWQVAGPEGTAGRWGFSGGASLTHNDYGNTNSGRYAAGAGALWWQPGPQSEVGFFTEFNAQRYDQVGPQLGPAGATLPPQRAWRSDGPHWAADAGLSRNHGLLLSHGWVSGAGVHSLRAGVFRSTQDQREAYAILVQGLQPDGVGQRTVLAEPRAFTQATSGELRWSLRWGTASLAHQVHLQFTGRQRQRPSGGGVALALGPITLGQGDEPPRPAFTFGPASHDRVRQHGLGLAYEARVAQHLEANVGVQQVNYHKAVQSPAVGLTATDTAAWLGYLSGAWHAGSTLAWYAGWTRGLEEGGVAPSTATNRGAAMPAILTRQADAGLRWQLSPSMKLVAGVFEVSKPYFNLDASQRFTDMGEVRHRGAELSLSGEPAANWRVVAGVGLIQARVQGAAVTLGRVGALPVGVPQHQVKLQVVWRPWAGSEAAEGWPGLSLDAALTHLGPVVATRDNQVRLPAYSRINLGLRWPLRLHGRDAGTLRWVLNNATQEQGFDLLSAGTYFPRQPRRWSATWTVGW